MSLSARFKERMHRAHKPRRYDAHATDLSDLEFVDLAYQVVLGRKADPFGLAHHTRQIEAGEKPRNQLVHELIGSPDFKAASPDIALLDEHDFVTLTYQVILSRKADAGEVEYNATKLREGRITRHHFIDNLYRSEEFRRNTWHPQDFWLTLHRGRFQVAAQLPKARRIVDLGGSCEGRPEGALVVYGYPYHFESLTIVELPREARFVDYVEICGEYTEPIQTPLGPVHYVYASMTELAPIADGSVDLVYAGQSIEHVTPEQAVHVLRQVHRILRPGGHFCFDTPNRNVTRLGFPDYIVDDHKYEYTHQEMVALLEQNGYAVRDAKGITLMDRSLREGRFIPEEALGRDRLYEDIEECFLLYYKAEKI